MDIYDFHEDKDRELGEEGSIDWEEVMAFCIAAIVLGLSIVGLITVIRMLV